MAAVNVAKRIHSVIPPGMELNDRAYATTDIKAGEPVVIVSTAPASKVYEYSVAKSTGTDFNGFALVDVKEGGLAEITMVNELDGFSGLTPGAALTVVDGKIDDTAPAAGQFVKIRALTTTRIRVMCN